MRRVNGLCLCLMMLIGFPCRVIGEEEHNIATVDAPVAVREAIVRIFPNAVIPTIEVEMRDGKPVYEVEVRAKGTTTIVKLDDQGKLLKTRIKKATGPDDDAGR